MSAWGPRIQVTASATWKRSIGLPRAEVVPAEGEHPLPALVHDRLRVGAVGLSGLLVPGELEAELVEEGGAEHRAERRVHGARADEGVAGVLQGVHDPAVLVVAAREVLVVVAHAQPMARVDLPVHLAQEDVLVAAQRVAVRFPQYGGEAGLGVGVGGHVVQREDHVVGDRASLPVVGHEEEGLVLDQGAAQRAPELVHPEGRPGTDGGRHPPPSLPERRDAVARFAELSLEHLECAAS